VAVLIAPRDAGTTSTSGRARYRDHRGPVWRSPTGFSLKAETTSGSGTSPADPTEAADRTQWTGSNGAIRGRQDDRQVMQLKRR
jgi:hypothetical protein